MAKEMSVSMREGFDTQAWLKNPSFDIMFIVGTAAIAIVSGFIVVANLHLFGLILFLDLWLLGYHHVMSTYTRLCFDKESLQQHRVILFGLPFIVLAGVIGISFGLGIWV
jgi:hypothetical protein